MAHTWIRKVRPKAGQTMRFFLASDGRWSACDNSGNTPDQTDDGPLWLSPHKVIHSDRGRYYVRVYKDSERGKTYTVGIVREDALWLQKELGFTFKEAPLPVIPAYDSLRDGGFSG